MLVVGLEHGQLQLEQAVGNALKQASAAPGSSPAVWGLYAHYFRSCQIRLYDTAVHLELLCPCDGACSCQRQYSMLLASIALQQLFKLIKLLFLFSAGLGLALNQLTG